MVFSSSANYSDEGSVFFEVCVFYQEKETDRNHDRNTCKYVDRKRLGSHAGRLEVSRWRTRGEYEESINPLHTGDKAHKEEIHPGFETQGRGYQKSKKW